uniref:Uncharacterized protein n=1 Tax=Anoplophora glabripennis TaxID=217634 RepID=V5GG02_ANOGL
MKIRRRSGRPTAGNIDEDCNDKNGKNSLFDSDCGYYHQIIYPLLVSGSEKDLICWLKTIHLIKSKQTCSKKMASGVCNSPMSLIDSKGPDFLQWKCKMCSKKKSIRDDSIFNGLRCNFKDAIRIILAWCKGYHVDDVANMLSLNNSVIEELYIRAASLAEKCMKSNIGDWQIGGPGVIVIVDTYPEGCTNTNMIRMTRPILCISEVKSIPQKYWLEALDRFAYHDTEHINSLKQRILRTIRAVVRPGSIIVTPVRSTLCSHSDFQSLATIYPTIVSVDVLAKHNNDHQNVFTNMETIWKQVLDICEEAQFYCSSYIDLFVVSHMWRAVYGNEAFERLLFQISAMQ